MKKIRIGKECNSNGRLKKSSRKELTMIKKKSVPIRHNNDNDERREKKVVQKIAAQKRAKDKGKKFINKFYLVDIKHKCDIQYSCGCIECESYDYGKRIKYASSAEEAVIQVLNLEFEDYIDYDFFDYHDDYYDDCVDRCVDLEIQTKMEFNNGNCPNCSHKVLMPGYNIEYNIDDLFNKYIYCHGVYAFNTGGNKIMIIERIKKILDSNNNMSICCSWKTQPIGPVGVYVNGKITLASNIDVSSYIHNGIRCFKEIDSIRNGESQIIESPLKLDFTIHNHCEFFMENPHITGIWIKKWFVEDKSTDRFILEKIYEIGKKNGIPIYIIGNRRNK